MTEKRKVLGRGLETLLPSRPPAQPHRPGRRTLRGCPGARPRRGGSRDSRRARSTAIPTRPAPTSTKPRLAELAASIQASGVVQPITVRPDANGRFQLIAGERRWLASKRPAKPRFRRSCVTSPTSRRWR